MLDEASIIPFQGLQKVWGDNSKHYSKLISWIQIKLDPFYFWFWKKSISRFFQVCFGQKPYFPGFSRFLAQKRSISRSSRFFQAFPGFRSPCYSLVLILWVFFLNNPILYLTFVHQFSYSYLISVLLSPKVMGRSIKCNLFLASIYYINIGKLCNIDYSNMTNNIHDNSRSIITYY